MFPPRPLRSSAIASFVALLLLVSGCGGESGAAPGAQDPTGTPPPATTPGLPTIFQAADVVLGQPTPDVGSANQGRAQPGADTLSVPVGLAITPEGRLLVADAANRRVLLFASVPRIPGPVAGAALGQRDLESSAPSLSREGLNGPFSVAVGGGMLAVADAPAHRVLIYDRIPAPGMPMPVPVAVIGQPDFESGEQACGRAGLAFPSSVAITPDGKLIVADAWNHRVLVWDAIPADQASVRPPTRVIGQRLLNRCIRNDDDENGEEDLDPRTGLSRASARTLRFPSGVWSDGERLVVADTANHRVLIWTRFPREDFQAAEIVLGHPDFMEATPNDERIPMTASTLFGPQDVHSDGSSLVVADSANHRVLIWKALPDRSSQPADIVLGHPTFHQSVSNDQDSDGQSDGPTARTLRTPLKVLLTPDTLLVSDSFHHRVLVFRRPE